MDIWTDFLQGMANILAPVSVMPGSTIFILFVSIGLALISIWATMRFTDMDKMKTDMEEIKAWQERFKKARQTMDPIELQQVMDDQGRIMRLNSSMMTQRMKPMCMFYIPLIIVFGILNFLFQGNPVAIIPFNIQEVLPFLDGWIGVNIQGSGFGLFFWSWYFLVSLGLGNLIRRPFGLSMTT
ncbi:MAG: EMC3/TMCO1 family protein [Candidatus Sifarchaeia archaeon]